MGLLAKTYLDLPKKWGVYIYCLLNRPKPKLCKTNPQLLRGYLPVADPEGGVGTFAPLKRKRERERERGGGGGRSSVPLLSISAFIHSPVNCNKSLHIFTRCIALLVYLITFEAVDD